MRLRVKRKIGMTLGKYAPFHAGHKYVIDTALAETDHVIIMSYDEPEVTKIPLPVRSGWIRTIYEDNPNVEVIDCYNGPKEMGYTPEIIAMHDEYILRMVGDRGITHFYSSEPYGDHVSKALGAVDRRVDMERIVYPISSTMIRCNAYGNMIYVPDVVYRDLIIKVVFLGSESTGKTTIAKALAERFNTEVMPEYGAEYWFENQKDGVLTPEQMVEIARGHLERENEKVLKSKKYCFIDTNAITTYMFALDYHGYALPELQKLAHNCSNRYDIVFLCEDDIPYDDTWDRRGAENRVIFQKKIVDDLVERKIPFIRLSGNIQERIAKVEKVLNQFTK